MLVVCIAGSGGSSPAWARGSATGNASLPPAERWRADLRFFVQCIRDIHPKPFWQTSEADFDSAVAALDRRLPALEDDQVAVGFMRIAALLCDGHSGVDVTPVLGATSRYPVRLYPFQDGVFVMSAASQYAEYVGTRVVQVGKLPVREALDRAMAIVGGENEYTRLNAAPLLLTQPLVVHALGISDAKDRLRFQVQTADGKQESFEASPVTAPAGRSWYSSGDGVPVSEYRTAREGAPGKPPLCWRDRDKNFWFEYLPEHRLLWMQFNVVQNAKDETLEQFCTRMFDFADHHDVDKFVIDLRWNGGGNLELLDPLIHGLIRREGTLNRPGHLFAVVGRKTFSAAHVCAAMLEMNTHVMFVGEPSGATPNHFGDVAQAELPYSKLSVYISKWTWQPVLPWDLRRWIAPQLPAPVTFADYRSNRDPALDAILRCDHYEPSVRELVRDKIETQGIEAGSAAYREWKPRHPDLYGWTTEAEMNSLAYRYLQDREVEKALAVLQLNLETYPGSAQAVEIQGEAYQAKGERGKATEQYRRALAMDPKLHVAAEMLRRVERDEPPSAWR